MYRIIVVPKLHQLQHDIGVFMVSAIKDLTKSIEQLEKARTDYRAAMLWLRNASTKLNDPDASRQLTKFREVLHHACMNYASVYMFTLCIQVIQNAA